MAFQTARRFGWLFLLSLLGVSAPAQQPPVVGRAKDFIAPHYDEQNRKKAVLFGKEAETRGNNIYTITGLKIESFDAREQIAWIVEAPECVYDQSAKDASSAGALSVRSADGQLTITGEGFHWEQTTQKLVISNNVRTIIHARSKTSTNTIAGLARQDLELTARDFNFDGQNSRAVYRENVRAREIQLPGATNAPMTLACAEMTISMMATGGVREVLAERDVVFLQGGNRASGDRGVYSATNDVIRVTGQAAWATELAEGTGDYLVFDRKNEAFQATGNTRSRIKSSQTTNEVIEVQADTLSAKLPAQGRQTADVTANGHVAIKRGTQEAGGEQMVYSGTATNGQATLTGKPFWHTPEAEGTADTLMFDRQKNEFRGRGNGFVKMRRAAPAPGVPAAEAMEIKADEYDFRTDQSRLLGHIAMRDPQWKLRCDEMTLFNVPGTNRLNYALAQGNLEVEQILPANSKQVPWKLTGKQMRMQMAADGRQVARIVANENILIAPARAAAKGETGLPWRLHCEQLTLAMSAKTSQVESILAEGGIRIEPLAADAAADFPWKLDCGRLTLFMAPARTNQVERVLAERDVRMEQTAAARNTGTGLWRMACDQALLRLSPDGDNQIRSVEAEKNVRVTQLATNGQQIAWTLASDQAALQMAASNRIEQVTASQNVRIEQGFTTNGAPMKLTGQNVAMGLSVSNTVQTLTARGQVVIEQGASRATGELGVYDGATENVQLSGHPFLVYVEDKPVDTNKPPQVIHISGADTLTWNRLSNHFRGKGPYRIIPKGPLKRD